MKTLSLYIVLCCVFLSSAFAVPWPLGDGAIGWESIFPMHQSFGNYNQNLFWIEVDSTYDISNFHNAIDISAEEAGTENIRAVEAGVFRDCKPFTPDSIQWFAQIFSEDSTYGWHYSHVQGDDGTSVRLDTVTIGSTTALYGDHIGTMAEISNKHLHFMYTDQWVFQNGDVGIDNPLDFLDSIPSAANGYTWELLTSIPAVFFLPQYDAIYGDSSWITLYDPPDSLIPGGNPGLVIADTLDRNGLSGAVDVFFGCNVRGYPQGYYAEDSGIPQRIEWSLCGWNPGTSSWESVFTKYVVDFDGEVGAAPEHWQKFRRFYFPYFAWQLFYCSDGDYISCLTNCSDATGWDGINNIEENCWNTVLASDGSGDSYNPLNQVTPDGPYQIDITAYAWDISVSQPVTTDVYVKNTRPIAWEVIITDQATDQEMWHAKWIASEGTDDFVPEKVILSDVPVAPGTDLEVEIIFSEPMDKNVAPLPDSFPISV